MTHEERLQYLRDSPRETISPRQLAQVMGGDPYYFNISAKAGTLKFPHYWQGRNLRILKQPVIDMIEGGAYAG